VDDARGGWRRGGGSEIEYQCVRACVRVCVCFCVGMFGQLYVFIYLFISFSNTSTEGDGDGEVDYDTEGETNSDHMLSVDSACTALWNVEGNYRTLYQQYLACYAWVWLKIGAKQYVGWWRGKEDGEEGVVCILYRCWCVCADVCVCVGVSLYFVLFNFWKDYVLKRNSIFHRHLYQCDIYFNVHMFICVHTVILL
jgi:hypothetical protein